MADATKRQLITIEDLMGVYLCMVPSKEQQPRANVENAKSKILEILKIHNCELYGEDFIVEITDLSNLESALLVGKE